MAIASSEINLSPCMAEVIITQLTSIEMMQLYFNSLHDGP